MTDIGTREKILRVAHQLFGERGFDGVSVREISKTAGVNISAINYHFENKENLFKETIRSCMNDMSDKVRELAASRPKCDTMELSLLLFEFFLENAQSLKLSFKMTVLDAHIFPHMVNQEDDFIGPPGGKVMYDMILSERPGAKQEDVIWAVRTIFALVVHKGLVACGHCLERGGEQVMGLDEVRDHISRVVRVVLADL